MQGHARRLEQQYSEGLPGDDLRGGMGIAGEKAMDKPSYREELFIVCIMGLKPSP